MYWVNIYIYIFHVYYNSCTIQFINGLTLMSYSVNHLDMYILCQYISILLCSDMTVSRQYLNRLAGRM